MKSVQPPCIQTDMQMRNQNYAFIELLWRVIKQISVQFIFYTF